MPGPEGEISEDEIAKLRQWRQGDYTLDVGQFVAVDGVEHGDVSPVAAEVPGWVVVSQTCDIVNYGEGREWVVVCPFRNATEGFLSEVAKARTPAAAAIEFPPSPGLAVDLNRMMTVHKRLLASLARNKGFANDQARLRFSDALARKHGRFAFPDAFVERILGPLRSRLVKAHNKAASENGKAWRSIAAARAMAVPSWEHDQVKVAFRFVLEPPERREAQRSEIFAMLESLFSSLSWPDGFVPLDPPFLLQSLAELTAEDWIYSVSVDWEFISNPS